MASTYTPFSQMKADLAKKPGVTNPGGLAAFIERKKYTKGAVTHAQQTGTSLRGKPTKKGKHHAQVAAFVKRNAKGA